MYGFQSICSPFNRDRSKLCFSGTVVTGHVGPVYVPDGTESQPFRQAWKGEIVTAPYGGKYKEAVRRGNCYSGTTAVTGVAPGTALGTTAAFALYNPAGTGKYLHVMTLSMGLISGTIGAGAILITSDGTTTAVPTGTAITPRNLNFGASNSSIATCLTTATITTNAAKMVGILCSLNQLVVATTAVNSEMITRDVEGLYCIAPGCLLTLHGTAAAGSTPLVIFNATWEEETIST
jgi:hypothetical protein